MPTVRIALDLDILQLVNLAKEYFDEADRWNHTEFNVKKACRYAALAMQDKSHQIFVAVDRNGMIVGFFWGKLSGQVWNDEIVAHESFFYVVKEHRNYYVGKDLLESFIKWAKACGADSFQVGAHSGINGDAPASALYKSLGFKMTGYNFNIQF